MSQTTDQPDLQADADADAEAAGITAASILGPADADFLLTSFTNFLAVALHSILFYRKLYPETTFMTARAYNIPVHQSRHSGVCAWIRDAVAAAAEQLRAGSARQISLVIHAPCNFAVAERWIFDVQSFPSSWPEAIVSPDETDEDSDSAEEDDDDAEPVEELVNPTDVNEALRAALSRLFQVGQSRPPLPDGCTFTLGVELRDRAPAPIFHPQLWIPSQPSLQAPAANRPGFGRALRGISTTPVRSVRAGPLFFECWVEQGKTKVAASETPPIKPSSTFKKPKSPWQWIQ
ncbi:hypothetical protein QQS21_003755 [Conoideocrella luteorostrata]|uniref:HORMA domain-containing protein n=1 Tax=Conoideocrella luteorostrata TaxID=1105319 RepID=A0AAJ0CSL6_9HYPO|nr:hypothetical protein QQS21_003755 [Conoideocrella luteorostrata]